MSEEIYATEGESLGEYEQPDTTEPHAAVIAGLWDVGMQESNYGGKRKVQHKVCLAWELDARDSKGRRFVLYEKFTLSMFEKAPLRKLADLLDKDTPKERYALRARLIGRCALLQLGLDTKGKAKVTGWVGLPKGMPKVVAEGDYTEPRGLAKWLIENAYRGGPTAAVARATKPEPDPDAPPF